MLKVFIFGVALWLLYRALARYFSASGKGVYYKKASDSVDEMVQDPVCHTYIPLRDAHRKVIKGKEYFFCSEECAEEFEQELKE